MVFQIPDTIEKKLSVKLKIAMVVGSVVVLVGATFAGYYLGQKKNTGQPQVVQNNDNTLPSTDTVGEVIPDPITVPDGGNNETDVNLTTTSLPQEIEKRIVWLPQTKEIINLNLLVDQSILYPDQQVLTAKYYEVGNFEYEGDKGRVIIVDFSPANIDDPEYLYLVEFKNQFVILDRYKGGMFGYVIDYPLNLSYIFNKNAQQLLKVDPNFTIDTLNFPKTISGLEKRQNLKLERVYLWSDTLIKEKGAMVFKNEKFGNVYFGSGGSFFMYSKGGLVAVYALEPDFITQTDPKAKIIWNDSLANSYEFSYGDVGGCGSINYISVVTSTDITLKNDLEVIGKTDKGESIYGLKDKNHRLLKYMYENMYLGDYTADGNATKISYESFITSKPMVFWVDPFGRLIKLENRRFVPAAECGKPVIYLYPEKTSIVDVKVEPQGGMTVSDPFYNGGWQVKAEPNGQLTEIKSGKQYPYLFWEGRGGLYQTPEKGFLMKKENIAKELPEKLIQLGLNANETKDFMEFWYPRMQAKPYYFVTFLGTQQMNQLAPLTINPRPNTVVRILMDFTPLDKPVDVLPLSLGRTPERKGFTVIEWGGVIR